MQLCQILIAYMYNAEGYVAFNVKGRDAQIGYYKNEYGIIFSLRCYMTLNK